MIIHHLTICLLFYIQVITCRPQDKDERIILPLLNESNPMQINGLSDPISDSYSDTAVDTLINKVVELSDRYRKDVNGTIADVHQVIQSDVSLPRLTRGEIIDLLENLTKTDPEEWRKKATKNRQDYQRAIMLVMPYTPKNSDSSSMEELYTRPPITHIIGTETQKPITTKKPHNSNKHIEIVAIDPSTVRPLIPKRPLKPVKFTKPIEQQQEVIKNQTQIFEPKPKKEVVIKQIPARQEPVVFTTRKPYAPRTTRFPNHRYPDESQFIPSNNGMKVIDAPILIPKPELLKVEATKNTETITVDDWHPPQKENKPHRHIYKATVSSTMRPRIRKTKATTTTSTTSSPIITSSRSAFADIGVPEEMKIAVEDVNFGDIQPLKPPKYSSHYDATSMNFPKHEHSSDNVRDLLDQIGVLPSLQTTTFLPDISDVADNLSPDMRDLLMTFGLLENPNKSAEEPMQPSARMPEPEDTINPYAYSQFKPLPDSAPSRKDMEEFLAGFGLTGNSQRSSKKLKSIDLTTKAPTHLSEVPNFDKDMIPESMHAILEDIGLTEKKTRKLLDQETSEETRTHVFSPEHTYVSEGEIKRLNQLLETIKRLEKLNRTATPEDLQDLDLENIRELTKILKQDSSKPLDQQNFGPDPLDFDISEEKNEVKRQETSTTTQKPSSSTEEAKTPSLIALEESFGGDAGKGTEQVDETLPAPRKTGFYYLVDWNSFLEVGEDDKKVNIRFTPRAGDPSRFLRVNVP